MPWSCLHPEHAACTKSMLPAAQSCPPAQYLYPSHVPQTGQDQGILCFPLSVPGSPAHTGSLQNQRALGTVLGVSAKVCWHHWYALSQCYSYNWLEGKSKLQSLQIQDAQSLVPRWGM